MVWTGTRSSGQKGKKLRNNRRRLRSSTALGPHPFRETTGVNDGPAMQSANDDFVTVVGLNLESNPALIHGNHPGGANNRSSDWRGGQMTEFQFRAHGPLLRLETIRNGQPRGAFEKTHQVGRGHHRRHAVTGKLHGMLGLRDDALLAHLANFGSVLQGYFWKSGPGAEEILRPRE